MTRSERTLRPNRAGRWRRPEEVARRERLDKVAAKMREANLGRVQGRLPVIRDTDGWCICQTCMVKWAHVTVSGHVFCVRCGNLHTKEQLERPAGNSAKPCGSTARRGSDARTFPHNA